MDTEKTAQLFYGWDKALIWSCLQGHMGRLETDHDTNPTSAMAEIGDFCFFAGQLDAAFFCSLSGSKLLVPQDVAWEQLIEVYYGARAKKTLRYAIKKEPDVFDREKLTAHVNMLGHDYELKFFDRALFKMAMAEGWSVDLCSQFHDATDYEKRAVGVAVLHEGKLVAGASPYAVYDGGIEIGSAKGPNPFRILGIVLVTLHCLDPFGIGNGHANTTFLENVEYWNPILSG